MFSHSQALEALSANQSAIVISRLSGLYHDMHGILAPALPKSNPVMITLDSPLSPTSSPLRSSRNFLESVLHELRKYCAPVRDTEVDAMLTGISASFEDDQDGKLPSLILQTIRSIFTLAAEMTSDLNNFALSNLTENEIIALITSEATRREVETVVRLYGGRLGVIRTWTEWLQSEASLEGNPVHETAPQSQLGIPVAAEKWKNHFIKALSTPVPISIVHPPMTELPPKPGALPNVESGTNAGRNTNELPAVFLISLPSLFRIQNLFQAIVITACLRLLVHPGSGAADNETDFEAFTSRIWILLLGEVENGQPTSPKAGGVESQLRLSNLEDEVWQLVWRRLGAGHVTSTTTPGVPLELGNAETVAHEKVRANVRRLLRTEDPVFALLMRRLVVSLKKWCEDIDQTTKEIKGMEAAVSSGGLSRVPILMKTGRAAPRSNVTSTFLRRNSPGKENGVQSGMATYARSLPNIKGFEGQTLRRALEDVAEEVYLAASWVEQTWDDILVTRQDSPSDRSLR